MIYHPTVPTCINRVHNDGVGRFLSSICAANLTKLNLSIDSPQPPLEDINRLSHCIRLIRIPIACAANYSRLEKESSFPTSQRIE